MPLYAFNCVEFVQKFLHAVFAGCGYTERRQHVYFIRGDGLGCGYDFNVARNTELFFYRLDACL